MKCRLCGGESRALGARDDVRLYRCGACDFVSGEAAAERAPEERYAGYHADAAPPPPETRYEEWLARAEAEVGRGRLLEIGAGSGGLVQVALRRGWTVDATEISRSGIEKLRATGARVFAGDLGAAAYADASFDAVVSLEVIEHLPAPFTHLREIARILRPGGVLLLTTPNFDGLSRRWLGLRWRVVHPEHLGYFAPGTLRDALRRAGFARSLVRSRSLDVSTWRAGRSGPAAFDPAASARLRDGIEGRPLLRLARETLNLGLAFTGVGDSLVAWARR